MRTSCLTWQAYKQYNLWTDLFLKRARTRYISYPVSTVYAMNDWDHDNPERDAFCGPGVRTKGWIETPLCFSFCPVVGRRNVNITDDATFIDQLSFPCCLLGQINRVKHVLDKDTLTIVVNCLVFSKLFYCSNVWSNTTESNLDKVQKVQNFACRIVSGFKKFDHITPVHRAMQWLPIRQQLYYRNTVMAFKCVTGCAPDSLTDQFIKRSDVSTRTTRNSQKLQIPFLKSATGQRSFYYRTVKIWNTLDPSLKLSKTLQEFKRKLKNFLLKDFIDRTT